jgi:hypothetical protein
VDPVKVDESNELTTAENKFRTTLGEVLSGVVSTEHGRRQMFTMLEALAELVEKRCAQHGIWVARDH